MRACWPASEKNLAEIDESLFNIGEVLNDWILGNVESLFKEARKNYINTSKNVDKVLHGRLL